MWVGGGGGAKGGGADLRLGVGGDQENGIAMVAMMFLPITFIVHNQKLNGGPWCE